MFIALSERNEVVKSLLGKFIALAPVYSIRNQQSELLKSVSRIAKLANTFYNLGFLNKNPIYIGLYQVLESTDVSSRAAAITCTFIPSICSYGLK